MLTTTGLEELMASNGLMMFGATILYLMRGWFSIVSVIYQPLEKAMPQLLWRT
jgi:hypothetical protein